MSISIDSNLRLDLGRQRQAALLQQAAGDQHEQILSAEIANDAARLPHPWRSIRHLRRSSQALPREAG